MNNVCYNFNLYRLSLSINNGCCNITYTPNFNGCEEVDFIYNGLKKKKEEVGKDLPTAVKTGCFRLNKNAVAHACSKAILIR